MNTKKIERITYIILFYYIILSAQDNDYVYDDIKKYYINFFPHNILCGVLAIMLILTTFLKLRGLNDYKIIIRYSKKNDIVFDIFNILIRNDLKFLIISNMTVMFFMFLKYKKQVLNVGFIVYYFMNNMTQFSGWLIVSIVCLFVYIIVKNYKASFLLSVLFITSIGFSASHFYTLKFLVYDFFDTMQVPLETESYSAITPNVILNITITTAIYVICKYIYLNYNIFGGCETDEV